MRIGAGKKVYIVLGMLIVLQLVNLIYCFCEEKKGYHSDEIYSYATANSYNMPFLGFEGRDDKRERHNNEWIDGTLFDEYLCADKEDRFEYGYIVHNDKDIHAPLYFMILHTISSVFDGEFSWWFGFSINIVLFMMTQIVLFLFVREMTDNNDILPLVVCFVYGMSTAGVNTYIYIRMYAMIVFFGVLLLYLHTLMYKKKIAFEKSVILISVVTFLGALTHMYFLVFAGLVSMCFCIFFLSKKKIKRMLAYGGMQLVAVLLFVIVHPYFLAEIFAVGERVAGATQYLGFEFESRVLIAYIIRELTAYPKDAMPSYFLINLIEILFWFVIIVLPIAFVFRKEKWFKEFLLYIKTHCVNFHNYLRKRISVIHITILVTIVMYVVVVSATAAIYGMGQTATRYVFILYPAIFALVGNIVYEIICFTVKCVAKKVDYINESVKRIRYIMFVLVAILYVFVVRMYGVESFYFDFSEGVTCEFSELPKEANYIIAFNSYWLIDCMSYELQGIDKFYATRVSQLEKQIEGMESVENDNSTYLILESPSIGIFMTYASEVFEFEEDEITELGSVIDLENENVKRYLDKPQKLFEQSSKFGEFDYIGIENVFGRYFFVYKVG